MYTEQEREQAKHNLEHAGIELQTKVTKEIKV
jgi:hypothetical protein